MVGGKQYEISGIEPSYGTCKAPVPKAQILNSPLCMVYLGAMDPKTRKGGSEENTPTLGPYVGMVLTGKTGLTS